MPRVDLVVETKVSRTSRARQLEGMFDVPASQKSRLEWHADVPIEVADWNVGLIVGPSGSGKTQIARALWGEALEAELAWGKASVIDDFDTTLSIEEITGACSAVGFNTIPAWLRPFAVLSNGERFRVDLARRILELADPVVVDEFTSVVDRQVAKIASHAVQKFVRRRGGRFVAVTCHYDVINWLQPDWIFEPATSRFRRRRLRRRPKLDVAICRIPHSAWSLFAPFHYLTAKLHRGARCWGLFVNGDLAAFTSILPRPQSRGTQSPVWGLSRSVTLPDYQGLGLIFVLRDTIASALKGFGWRTRSYPAHAPFIRTMDRSATWKLIQKPGVFKSQYNRKSRGRSPLGLGACRPNAVFEYIGPAMDHDQAVALWGPETLAQLRARSGSAGRSRSRKRGDPSNSSGSQRATGESPRDTKRAARAR